MARYFMQLRKSTDEPLDPDGPGFASRSQLRDAVLFALRDLVVLDVRDSVLDLRFRIDAQDDGRTIVHTMPFKYALTAVPFTTALPGLEAV